MREKQLEHDAGMIITPCNQVHTFFMKFAIDIVFCDKKWKIIEIIEEVPKGKITKYVKNAKYVLELPAGRTKELGIIPEDQMHIYFDGGKYNEEKKSRDN